MRRTGVLLALVFLLFSTATVADAASRALYRATGSDNHVLAYGLAPTGALFPIAGSPLAISGSPQGLALTPDGRFLYVSLSTSNQIAGFSVNPEGALSALPGSPFVSGPDPLGVAISPDGRSIYSASGTGNAVYRQTIDVDGSLSAPGAPVSTGASSLPTVVAITPDGRHLYASTFNLSSVSGFDVAANGTLSPVPGSPYPAPNGGVGIAIAPDGAHLYMGSTFGDSVYAASIAADGSLTAVTGSPFPSGPGTRGIAITPDGRRLYATNTATGMGQGTWGYGIAADGSLTAGTAFSPAGQAAIAMAPDSRHLYLGAAFGGATNGVSIGTAGELTPVPGNPFANSATGSDAWQMAISPDQPPLAAFAATPGVPGSASVFDASASVDPDGSIARYEWSFGDGATATGGPVTTHSYAAPGTYRVTLTETDAEGCSTRFVFTGQTAMCDGSQVAAASQEVVVPEVKVTPSPAAPGPPSASPAQKPPALRLTGKKKQVLGPTVSVGAVCDEACVVSASGSVRTKAGSAHRVSKLKPKSTRLAAGATGTLKLKLPKAGRKAVAGALASGGSAVATLTITATDGSGNATAATRAVRLVLKH